MFLAARELMAACRVFPCWTSTHEYAPPDRNDLQSRFEVMHAPEARPFGVAQGRLATPLTTQRVPTCRWVPRLWGAPWRR